MIAASVESRWEVYVRGKFMFSGKFMFVDLPSYAT